MNNTKTFFAGFLLFISISFTAYSQGPKKNMTTWEMIKYDGLSVYGGVKHAYTRPFKWKEEQWATFAITIAANTAFLALDNPANDYFTNQSAGVPDVVKEAGFRFGKPLLNYGLTTSIYTIGLITKNEKIRKTGVLLIASATAGGLLQTFSKTAVGRARPLEGEGNLSFRFWSNEAGYHSFPSGHAILSFTTAHAIAKQFDNILAKGGIYALGLITPVSRLWSGAHWLTDVTLGLAISVFIVDSIDNYLKDNERYSYANKKKKVRWNLKIGAGQLGVVGRF